MSTSRSNDLPLIEPTDRSELRAWFEANHATSRAVQVAIGKKGTTVTSLTLDDAVEEALCFGWIDSTARRLDADRYALRFSPRKPGGTWARSNRRRVEKLIAEGLMRPAGLAAVEAAKADGSWNSIDNAEDLRVPDDLAAAFAENPEAERFWNALPPSHRKMTLHWVNTAKRSETRSKRIDETVRAAAEKRRRW